MGDEADTLLERVRAELDGPAAAAADPRVTLGERVLAVDLAHPDHGRLAGLAHRPDEGDGAIGDTAADGTTDDTAADGPGAAEDTAGAGDEREPADRGRPWERPETSVRDLAALATDAGSRTGRAVGIATLNALSVPSVEWRVGDPMASLSTGVSVVATVGLFRPAFKKFGGVTVRVVERDPPDPEAVATPHDVAVETYAPADCAAAFDGADVCFVTGATLIYGGIDRYLDALSSADVAPVVLVGATASHLPRPAFEAGVDVVAGALVTDPGRAVERVRAGDCGTDLHGAGVEKVYVARRADLPGLTLSG